MNRVYTPEEYYRTDMYDEIEHVRVPLVIPGTRAKTWPDNPYRKEFDKMRGAPFDPAKMPDWWHKRKPGRG